MGKTLTTEAIVLATHNVGEADRFCILFTRERGKLAARARGVRKPGSRLGGCMLPLQHVSLQLREGSAGFLVTDAQKLTDWNLREALPFVEAEQGMELLLATLQDEEPMPELFEAALALLARCAVRSEHAVLPFTIRLLKCLGLLPDADDAFFPNLSAAEKLYLTQSANGAWDALPSLTQSERKRFSIWCAELLSGISSTALKAGAVLLAMKSSSVHSAALPGSLEVPTRNPRERAAPRRRSA